MTIQATAVSDPQSTTPSDDNLFHHLLLRSCYFDSQSNEELPLTTELHNSFSKSESSRKSELTPLEIIGHRGAGCSVVGGESRVPENSIAAFEKAVEMGLTAVEIDVWLTADNQVVVVHGVEDDGFLYETVAVPTCPSVRFQRIELLNYWDWRSAGLLCHRQPWPLFVASESRNISEKPIDEENEVANPHSSSEFQRTIMPSFECDHAEQPVRKCAQHITCDLCNMSATETDASAIISFHRMNSDQREAERLRYLKTADRFSHEDILSEVPLLDTVFSRFHGQLRFNVELKGTNPLLGTFVLDIARKFPGIISRISSFHWKVSVPSDHLLFSEAKQPVVSQPKQRISVLVNDAKVLDNVGKEWPGERGVIVTEDETEANNTRVFSPNKYFHDDLLHPLIDNVDAIPLALLFQGVKLPSVQAIICSMRHYRATWAHVPQMFHLDNEADQIEVGKVGSRFLRSLQVLKVLNQLSCSCQQELQSCPELFHSYFQSASEYQADGLNKDNPSLDQSSVTKQSLVRASANLLYLTTRLHKEGFRVMVYSGHINEDPVAMQLALLCGIDGVCVNDVASAETLATRSRSLLADDASGVF